MILNSDNGVRRKRKSTGFFGEKIRRREKKLIKCGLMREMNDITNVRSAKKIKEAIDESSIVGYYQSGWSVVEIAAEAECKVQEVLLTLEENNIAVKEEHLKEAASHLEMENELGLHMLPRAK